MDKELSEDEAEEFVFKLLQDKKRLTTNEVEQEMKGLGMRCADGPARVLSKMKFKGRIQGKLSIKDKGWVWWI